MKSVQHIWFDFSDTIASPDEDARNTLRYKSYGEVIGKPVTPELIEEFKRIHREQGESNAGVFSSLGLPSGYWSDRVNASNPGYRLLAENIPVLLEHLKGVLPISIFSNLNLSGILPALGLEPTWFTHILAAGMFKNPKPALDGFYKLIELSALPPKDILYIGDNVYKDLLPAKQVGMQTGLVWSASPEADYSFKNFDEILNLFAS